MSSYIILELDTTPPEIEVYIPSYTTTELLNEITITSNKDNLSDYQEVYVIDRNGNRHDYTFQRENENEYMGIVKFALFPVGMATIYVRMMDDVGNLSDIIEKSFEIKESLTILTLNISDKQLSIKIDSKSANTNVNNKSTTIMTSDDSSNININNKSMKIELKDMNKVVDTNGNN